MGQKKNPQHFLHISPPDFCLTFFGGVWYVHLTPPKFQTKSDAQYTTEDQALSYDPFILFDVSGSLCAPSPTQEGTFRVFKNENGPCGLTIFFFVTIFQNNQNKKDPMPKAREESC